MTRAETRASARRWFAGVAVAALALLATIAAWQLARDGERPLVAPTGSGVARPVADAAPEHSAANASPTDDSRGALAPLLAQRLAEPAAAFASPPESQLAEIESRGRLLLWGEILDVAGAPCPDAVIWHDCRPIARSDALGRYEIEIDDHMPDEGWHGEWFLLAAVKEGTGSGMARFEETSQRLDFVLSGRTRLSGTTVATGSRAPIAGARVELGVLPHCAYGLGPVWRVETLSDEKGAFEFTDLPATAIAARATAERFASAGWSTLAIDQGDVIGVDFELMRRVEVRGRFEPWPLAALGLGDRKARVVALPTKRREVWEPLERIEAPVAADGAFALPVAESFDCELSLDVGGGAPWSGEALVPPDGGDVELGVIALREPAWIEVEMSLPRDLVEFGVVARAWSVRPSLLTPCLQRIGLDGRARLGPFDGRPLGLGVYFEGERYDVVASVDLEPLAPGEVRRIAPAPAPRASAWLYGRCVEVDGTAAVNAALELVIPREGRAWRFGERSDREGRWLLSLPPDTAAQVLARGRSIELIVRGRRSVARLAIDGPLPASGAARRVDVTLAPARGMRGRVVHPGGVPLAGASIELQSFGPDGERQQAGMLEFILLHEGSFAIDALEERDYGMRIQLGERWLDLGRVRPGDEPITLQIAKER